MGLTSTVRVQRTKRGHETGTREKSRYDGETQPAYIELQAPAVDQTRRGDDEEEGHEAAVESVLRYSLAPSFFDLLRHCHVGEAAARDGAQQEARSRGDVEQARHERGREVEAGVDQVSRSGQK